MPITDASFERPVDLVHLARQTLGDRDLEQEILTLFVRQSAMLSRRLAEGESRDEKRDLAHTLKGSARAVGAWRVARAAEAVEVALALPPGGAEAARALAERLAELRSMVEEANDMIASLVPA